MAVKKSDPKDKESKDKVYRVRSVSRAISILRAFSMVQRNLSLAEISKRADIDKGTARRILMTLIDEGLVNQEAQNRNYSLGLDILDIAGAVPQVIDLREHTQDILDHLSKKTRATTFFSTYRDGYALCLNRLVANTPVQIHLWNVGQSIPMDSGAAPRLLLAFLEENETDHVMNTSLIKSSKSNLATLKKTLTKIRRDGWLLVVDDVAFGLSALAVPIKDQMGNVIAALSIGGLTPLIVANGEPLYLDLLLESAEQLSKRIMSRNIRLN